MSLIIVFASLLALVFYTAFIALSTRAMQYDAGGQVYECSIEYESISKDNKIPIETKLVNMYTVIWSYEGLCNISARSVNKTHVAVQVMPLSGKTVLVAFEVYKRFNYAWLTMFNGTHLNTPIFVGFTPVYSTLAVNRSLNDMMLVYQGSRVVVRCGDLILGNTRYMNVWIVEGGDSLLAIYGTGHYPIYAASKIRLPDGVHVIEIRVKRLGVDAHALHVCSPEHYIDLRGLAILIAFAAVPAAVIIALRRR